MPPCNVAALSGTNQSALSGLHRRDLAEDQHGSAQGMSHQGRAPAQCSITRTLEHINIYRRSAHDRIDAPWVFDNPMNGDVFRTYVKRILGPTLKRGDVVIM